MDSRPATGKVLAHRRHPIESLVGPYGLVGRVYPPSTQRGLWRLQECVADLGSGLPGHPPTPSHRVLGAGRALDDLGLARTTAIAEAAERYSGHSLHGDPVWARVADLDGAVLDVTRIPRCSALEYAHPGCLAVPFDQSASIRWVKGTDLASAEKMWVPAVMACFGVREVVPGERFWYSISTGYAVHTDPAEALVRAICEVAERDIVAIGWLQRLPLPPLSPGVLTDGARYLVRWAEEHFVRAHVFDATTDLGVPTAYCLLIAEHDERVGQTVGCGCGRSMGAAAEKAVVEALAARSMLHRGEPGPQSYEQFTSIDDGARYMAAPDRATAFDFLTGDAERAASAGTSALPDDPADALSHLIRMLAEAGMRAIAVDRTTRELAEAGLTAVAAVIPDLQPMTLHPLTQFRAHPRLYALPARMGYRCLGEEELNPWPQPFP
jgi:ribosomal protein S12 methylthiotransferase accessory factor